MKMLLVADHTLFRDGLKHLLIKSNQLDDCSEASDLHEAINLLDKESFDLVLVDIKLRDAIGLDSLREIKRKGRDLPVITISDDADFHLAKQAIAFGASGYLSKSSSYHELQKAVNTAVSGRVYLAPELTDTSNANTFASQAASDISVLSSLSDRQREVLQHIAKGTSNKAISVQMNISQNTVKAHLATIFKILGVHNRTEAFYFAARAGLPLE